MHGGQLWTCTLATEVQHPMSVVSRQCCPKSHPCTLCTCSPNLPHMHSHTAYIKHTCTCVYSTHTHPPTHTHTHTPHTHTHTHTKIYTHRHEVTSPLPTYSFDGQLYSRGVGLLCLPLPSLFIIQQGQLQEVLDLTHAALEREGGACQDGQSPCGLTLSLSEDAGLGACG